MRRDGRRRLSYVAAVRAVREWHAVDCRRGETAAEVIAAGYPTDPGARGRWADTLAARASMDGMPAAWMPGDRAVFWEALRIAGVRALRSEEPIPPELRCWLADALDGRRPRPKGSAGRRLARDVRIAVYAARLDAAGFVRTRSKGRARACAEGGSAADVIGAALRLSYKRVANIISGRPSEVPRMLIDLFGGRSQKPAD